MRKFLLMELKRVIVVMLTVSLFAMTLSYPIQASEGEAQQEATEDFEEEQTFILTDDGQLLPLSELENIPCPLAHDCATRIELGHYTMSKATTKTLAKRMKAMTGNYAVLFETVLGSTGVKGAALSACIALSANAAFRSSVVYAGTHNKRVKVTITDSKYCHTTYSQQVKYKVVK